MANTETTIDFVSELQSNGYRVLDDGKAAIVITGEGRQSRARRYETAQVAYNTLVLVPMMEAKGRN